MMILAMLAGYCLLMFVTFILFLAVMMLKRTRDTLPPIAKRLGYLVLGIGYLVDFAFNMASTVPFLDLPRELLFTGRVSRLQRTTGWRARVARWFCANLLEPFDPGHCG